MRLQEGIYWQSGKTPGPAWRLVLLNIQPNALAEDARHAITLIWNVLVDLRQGRVRDLNPAQLRPDDPPEVLVPSAELTCLLGFGRRFFDPSAHPTPLTRHRRPADLRTLSPEDPYGPFERLHWAPNASTTHRDSDLAIQLIAKNELAVNRAIVEIRKIIDDRQLPIDLVGFHSGFGREDHRSWIDFHDGINTLSPEQRAQVIPVGPDLDTPWMVEGTYMVFLRIAVDLARWRALTRAQQELIVGREKLSGCPLLATHTDAQGQTVGDKALDCVMPSGTGSLAYIDPPRTSDRILHGSHIHRSNFNRGADPREHASNRIYRQGYEFLELTADANLRLGLNFVSFQESPRRVSDILNRPDWMGGVNFGGYAHPMVGDPPDIALMALLAGGFFAVPPQADPFPGAALFG